MASRRGRRERRGKMPSFVPVFRYLMRSPAWSATSPVAKAAFLELGFAYNGSNNGCIRMSARELAAKLNCSKDTANRGLNELEDKGFIETTLVGKFERRNRKASEYRLTCFPCDLSQHPSSKKFLFWQAVPKRRVRRASSASQSRSADAPHFPEVLLLDLQLSGEESL